MKEFITVKVGKLPGHIQDIALNGDCSVADALKAADLNPAGFEIRVNGKPAATNTTLSDGSTVTLIKKIIGN